MRRLKPRTGKTGLEKHEQGALKRWCDLSKIEMVHIPNEGKRRIQHLVELLEQGLRPGFPDVIVFLPPARTIFIELKQSRNYTASEQKTQTWRNQQAWLDWLNSNGYAAKRCFGCQDAINFINTQKSLNHDNITA